MKQLKSELVALDRKIAAELAPTHEVPDDRIGINKEEQDGKENMEINTNKATTQSNGSQKSSMVAEPQYSYNKPISKVQPYRSL